MIRCRHPEIADEFLHELDGGTEAPCLAEAAQAARNLVGVMGFDPPSWHALIRGAQPPLPSPADFEHGFRTGWQHEASSRVERSHRAQLFPRMGDASRALVRSQAGPGTGLSLSTCLTCRVISFESDVFRTTLLCRLQLPLPLTVRTCWCGRPLDVYGHHRAACPRVGVIWTEPHGGDGRRLVVDGLLLFGGAQLAVDTTLVSTLHGDGSARRRAVDEDGVALAAAPESERDPSPRVGGPPCQSAACRPGGRSRWALV